MSCNGACHPHPEGKVQPKPADDADVWASDDEHVSVYADLKRAHVNQGYLDGLTHTQELELQKGFDAAYPEGADLGMRVGRVLARLHGTPDFVHAKSDLSIARVLDTKHYDLELKMEGEHPVVAEWERRVEQLQTTVQG